MDEKTKNFRLRLAQVNGVNGVKLNESEDPYDKMHAPVLQTYHGSMANHIKNGMGAREAHKKAMEDVLRQHGKSGRHHVDDHYSALVFGDGSPLEHLL